MMPTIEEGIEQLQQEFADAKIPTDEPGFYEDRAFIRREQKDPHYLDNYARFVEQQPYSRAYIEHVEPVVHVVSEEMQFALKHDGSQEAHAEAPFVISRMLEREGVWNYVVSGSLIITFPGGSGFAPYTFRTTDLHRGTAIDCSYHWVVAPPFQVIDIAIQTCQYPYPFMHLLPKIVWETNGEPAVAEPSDIFTDHALDEIAEAGMTTDEALDRYFPTYRSRFAADFPARIATRLDTQLKYVPMRVMVAEPSLEQFTAFQSRGFSAAQIYAKKVRPRLS